jgi:hypothetical protein
MTTIALNDVSAWAERDSFFLYFAGALKAAAGHVATWIFLPFFVVGALGLAQFYPSRVLEMIRGLNAALPKETDTEHLELVRDMLRVVCGAGQFYQHFCLRPALMREALSEVDETIDSISFVLNNKQELKQFVADSEARRSPQLQLTARRVG